MSKAILVMDMPSKCSECTACHIIDGTPICQAKIKDAWAEGKLGALYKKPAWCPLRPMPEKKQHTLYSIGAWNSGYNACIDEILGDKE